MAEKHIIVKGARVHNLKNISLKIPHNKIVAITGVSGSGKSSLAFDTLYAEGQRKYVESLSSYARQFLSRIEKPDVDQIEGMPPAIAIEQKVNTKNPRSTVGTSTEIYDYLKLLFARIGKTYSPLSGSVVKKHTPTDVVNFIYQFPENTQIILLSPISPVAEKNIQMSLNSLLHQGFSRVYYKNKIYKIDGITSPISNDVYLVIDRFTVMHQDKDTITRIADSVETAFEQGKGKCLVIPHPQLPSQVERELNGEGKYLSPSPFGEGFRVRSFSNKFEADGMTFEEPTEHLFSFNSPYGACPKCEGFGNILGIDENLVIPDKSLSVAEGGIACWRGEILSEWNALLIKNAHKFNFPIHCPYYLLNDKQKRVLWTGNEYFYGINEFFQWVEKKQYKIQYRVLLAKYRGKTICPECNGTRLRKEATYVKIANKSITELVTMSIKDLLAFFTNISKSPQVEIYPSAVDNGKMCAFSNRLNDYERAVAKHILAEITHRLQVLCDVGLGYLTLNRAANTLSRGESQRIYLASSLGNNLTGSLYILDEPTIGLHPRDTHLLIKVLKQLKELGNTIIVVEHDEEVIKSSDEIIVLGPLAGRNGGEIVFQGSYNELLKENLRLSDTVQYLSVKNNSKPVSIGVKQVSRNLSQQRRKTANFLIIKGARENNLKNLDVHIPLQCLCVITGVSGSGKSSLVQGILYPAVKNYLGEGGGLKQGKYDLLEGIDSKITSVIFVDQSPIGRSTRSNPVTYVKAYDYIRDLFAKQSLAKARRYKPGDFSFNSSGGRCEECQGEGIIKIEMQFMADARLVCESCKGKRFKEEILQVTYRNKNIYDILTMTVDEAIEFFSCIPQSNTPLNPFLLEWRHISPSIKRGAGGVYHEKENQISDTPLSKKIIAKLKPLADVGLGYLQLGQSTDTLSGGEAQRLKLASFLSNGLQPANSSVLSKQQATLFIFDEPTTGLHSHDIEKLLFAFKELIRQGHSIVVVEHNLQVIKCADYIIDLGPEGGDEGGYIVFQGTPEEIINCKKSYTGRFLN